ncbi:MAG: reverse transcriptase family protein [Bacteroidota bacterium]
MNEQPKTRQELYEIIRQTSRDELVLAEMKRLGFWETNEEQPTLPETLIKRRGELHRALKELTALQRKISDPEKLLKEYRQKRLQESREKQQANRERRAKEREEKAAKWKDQKTNEILYLGEGISYGLNHQTSDLTQLKKYALPAVHHAKELADLMRLTVGQLRFLAYHREVSKISHYHRFYMAKKSGGKRLISAPMPLMKTAQYWIVEQILDKVPVHEAAHGFTKNRSILSNAQPHVGQDLVVNLDFKNFFPTIDFARVKGVFRQLGYSNQVATILGAICTEPDQDKVTLDGRSYYVAKGERHLPQGAPSSPVLTNILCYKLDKRLAGLAQKYGFQYTRYADDLSFSASNEAVENLTPLLWAIRKITKAEGFELHPDKLRIMRKGSRQEVTGLIVNEAIGIERKKLRAFRALLHQIKQTGWSGKQWGNTDNIYAAVWGYANFIAMVKPERGSKLLREVKALMKLHPVPKTEKTNWSIQKVVKSQSQQASKQVGTSPNSDDEHRPIWKLW